MLDLQEGKMFDGCSAQVEDQDWHQQCLDGGKQTLQESTPIVSLLAEFEALFALSCRRYNSECDTGHEIMHSILGAV